MVPLAEPAAPSLPFPVFQISQKIKRYLLYDINVITWLRKVHHILGVLIGTLPQIPQQNVFLGLPLELMPEEARLLVDKHLAFVVDDLEWHIIGLETTTAVQREAYRRSLEGEGKEAAKVSSNKKQQRIEGVMKRLQLENDSSRGSSQSNRHQPPNLKIDDSDSPFDSASAKRLDASTSESQSLADHEQWTITPTTSYPPPKPQDLSKDLTPNVKASSYALFSHLHQHDYFLSPGLRFGCQFLVYPGDPLRYHSHFLAVSAEWDEDINLLDLVGGGRLGTGVKKGWLIGGVEDGDGGETIRRCNPLQSDDECVRPQDVEQVQEQAKAVSKSGVRTFCIEWGGM